MRRTTLAAIFVVCVPGLASAQSTPPGPPVIVANGEAVLRRAADRALLTVATEVRDGKAANARKKSAEGMTEIRAAIVAAGVPESAIRTTGYSLQPEFEYSGGFSSGRPSVRNYVVRNQIELRIDEIDKLADVIDAANMPKNIAVTIGSPRYELKDREGAELEATRLAVQNAMARAKALAAGAGQTLGPVQRIEQGSVHLVMPQPMFRTQMGVARDAARSAGGAGTTVEPAPPETPITPGDLEIRASVTVTVAIK
jgi:uncharacterized protein YggE